jgi:intracellular sulfur oxidation DsrE/DsrF family protein
MKQKVHDLNTPTPRRGFLGTLAASAAAIGVASITSPLRLSAAPEIPIVNSDDPDAWFSQIKGKHRMVLDVPRPNDILPFAWPKVFLMTNAATGTPEKNNSVVVVLRHDGIPYAFEDRLWAKYKFGELFKVEDPVTKAPAIRNPFWNDQLQASGVLFCVCDVAMTVYSTVMAQGMKADPAEVKKEWLAGLLPGVQPVPSGIWAVGRAQEHGCNYCFAG